MKPTGKLMLTLLVITSICSCERQNVNLGALSATVSSDMVCRSGEPLKSGSQQLESSCIRYSYDGDSLLSLAHLNASFNCCPEKFLVDIEVKGDSLIIREENAKLGCKCNCIYNLDILVHNLPADTYHVRFVEPNVHGDKPQLVFDLDLKKKREGQVCVTRGLGWWR